MNILAIGGPRHGQQLPHAEGQKVLIVPVMPDIRSIEPIRQYTVHGGYVRSIRDGDRHFVPAPQVALLYRLKPGEFRILPNPEHTLGTGHWCDEYCVFPDQSGDYLRVRLYPLMPAFAPSITVARYNARIVSDRLVWVYVGE